MADSRRLPVPVTDTWGWQIRGACRGLDSGFFFHPDGERGARRIEREAQAKQICRRCPALEQCRRHALAVQEPHGVWGGLSLAGRAGHRACWLPSTSDGQIETSEPGHHTVVIGYAPPPRGDPGG